MKAKQVRAIFLVLFVFGVIPVLLLTWLWKDRCAESIVATTPSADGLFTVGTSLKDCGPAMKVATTVTVFKTAEPRSGLDVLVLHGETPVEMNWTREREVTLTIPEGSTVVSRRASYQEVAVRHEITVTGVTGVSHP